MPSQAKHARPAEPARDPNAAQVASSSSPSKIHLTDLPPDSLDLIFQHVNDKKPPLCKTFLPFQRRQYRQLCLPPPRKPTEMNPFAKTKPPVIKWDFTALLASSVRLTHLTLAGGPETPALLLTLPTPAALRSLSLYADDVDSVLRYHPPSLHTLPVIPGADLAPALARLTALERLEIDCPVEGFSGSAVQSALAQLVTLAHLTLGEMLRDHLELAPLSALVVTGPGKLPALKTLGINMHAEAGPEADDVNPRKAWHFEDGWELPHWGKGFPRKDVEELMRQAVAAGIKVEGSVLEAMQVEDAWLAEQKQWDKVVKRQRKSDREYEEWRAQCEAEEQEERNEWDEGRVDDEGWW
ncbi:hypothetical protein JCM10207_004302 [Rhodosporidiobolus poonsookiae]